MIEIRNLTKSYRIDGGRHYVFRDVSAVFPENANIGIIGPNGGGKSTFLRLLGGIDHPDSGRIISNKTFSWPLALKGGFVNHLSGRENCRMVCNLYGLPPRLITRKLEEIKELSGIGKYFEEPVKYYSSGMGGRLGFALSMSFDFDYFLIDEITSVGDAHFKALAKKTLEEKAKKSRVIMVSHSMGDLKKFCDVAVLVSNGQFRVFDNLDEAIRAYLPQSKEAAKDAKQIIRQSSVEELSLDAVKLPPGIADHVEDIEKNLAEIDLKLSLPTHRLPANETNFFYALAYVYEQIGDEINARIFYERAAAHNPYHISTQLKLADIALRDGDTGLFARSLDAIEAADPQNIRLLYHRIRQNLRAGTHPVALEKTDEALRIAPEHPAIWHLRAQVLLRLQKLPDALAAQIKAVHHDPKSPAQYIYLAKLLANTGDVKTAQLAQHKARLLRSAPALPPAEPSLAKLSKTLRKLNQALSA
jgi:capsular polysaccharide transport system ATP-binding protein